MKTMTTITYSALALLALACLALTPQARAVCQEGCDSSNFNAFLGDDALISNTDGFENTASGASALYSTTNGWANTATGSYALYANTSGTRNTATGDSALGNNLTGERNVGTGYLALGALTTGGHNVGFGTCVFCTMTSGEYNTALGYSAGWNLTTGNNNILVNNVGVATESNTIRIGSQVAAVTADGSTQAAHTTTYIAGISGTALSGRTVMINASGRLGTAPSSARFKEGIMPMDKASETIFALKPVAFRYKKEVDAERTPQFGLVAEDVEKVNPDLVARDEQGKPYTVRYEAVNAMLLNEFLKEHGKNEKQEVTITELKFTVAQQQKQIEALTAGLQKVSAQLELSKAAALSASSNN